ncbi:uncharacterized protein PRCAT00004948001 [Priceomyces carsonii]|uniref:uncharacterized protein n=1 Tax=Priceomyces carsonii TaxID=28549 RepID=UPI002ED83CA5|nr:unnamed protein product [Priceomyces carsonii]
MDDSDEEYTAPSTNNNSVSVLNSPKVDNDDILEEEGVSKRTRSSGNSKAGGSVSDLKHNNGYAWEDQYQRSWDIVKDDEDGTRSLESIIQTMIENRKKKIMKNSSTPFQRGIIRTLIVIIDGSLSMLAKDLRPSRFSMMLSLLQDFVVEFFDQNPISQMGIVMMRNGVSTLISEVSGLPQHHIEKIRQLKARQHNRFEPKGDPSLQNALEIARSLLSYNFGSNTNNTKNSKEILIIFGALFTSDPGDIHKTIDNLVKDEIKVKVIGLSAQVAICQELVSKTNHTNNIASTNFYGVILNESHFRELLMDSVVPLPISEKDNLEIEKREGVTLLKMGFPSKIQPYSSLSTSSSFSSNFPQLCACHPTSGSEDSKNVVEFANNENPEETNVFGYQCPQCKNKICHLPTICPICGLMLILSTHLARSYHHLVPLKEYQEVPVSESYKSSLCFGCLLKFPEGYKGKKKETLEGYTSSRYSCPKCKNDFCIDCDVFVHEVLHNCPGCESNLNP